MDILEWVALANELLADFGSEFIITRNVKPGRDANGHETPGGWQPLAAPVLGVVQEYSPYEATDSRILTGDVKFVCNNQQLLEVGDRVAIGGEVWRVERPGPVRPHGGVVIVHKAQLRRV